jgi:hypothetical protein
MSNDDRALLLDKPFNLLTLDDRKNIKNYKMKIFRLKLKSEGDDYNKAAMEHMRKKRAETKIINKTIIDNEILIKDENIKISVLLNNKDKIITQLVKELAQKSIITPDIIVIKPLKNVKPNPILNDDKRIAKINIISNVILKIYGIELSTTQLNLFNSLMDKKILVTKQNIDESFVNLQFLYNDGIDDFIKLLIKYYPSPSTSKNYLAVFQYFLNVLSKIEEVKIYFEEAYFKLYTITKSFNKDYQDTKLTGEIQQIKNGLLFNYNPIETIQKINNFCFKKPIDKLIYAFYTLMPPRRVNDVYILELTDENDITKLTSKNNNYIMIDKNGIPNTVIYNNYKTNSVYGQQVFKLDNLLSNMIQEYIKNEKLNYTNKKYLFTNTKPSNQSSNFSIKIQKIFNEVYDIKDSNGKIRKTNGISVDVIRESSSTYYTKKYHLTPNKLIDIASKQAHSVSKLKEYSKNISFETDNEIYNNVQLSNGIQEKPIINRRNRSK